MKRIAVICLAASLSFLVACSSEKENHADGASPSDLSKSMVEKVYGLYLRGDYTGYVSQMLAYDNTSSQVRQQMALSLKQHAATRRKAESMPQRAEVVRIHRPEGAPYAEAFLSLTYPDGNDEEIALRFVWHDGRWRLR